MLSVLAALLPLLNQWLAPLIPALAEQVFQEGTCNDSGFSLKQLATSASMKSSDALALHSLSTSQDLSKSAFHDFLLFSKIFIRFVWK